MNAIECSKLVEEADKVVRAQSSQGSSSDPIYQMVLQVIAERQTRSDELIDVGCGSGKLWSFVHSYFNHYIGVDAVAYEGFPINMELVLHDLDAGKIPLPDAIANVVCAVETIEHLENPRALMRELVRLTKPGGWTIVTTPNQLSLLSKFTLVFKNQFNAFQEAPGLYPTHITALLEIDLIRIAQECGLTDIEIHYSNCGRIPFTPWHWSTRFGFKGRTFSDNVLCLGRKPEA